jgi:uncharacterized heparinase superfamily protein
LSFVAWLDGEPVVVDTGTSEYGAGPRRAYERSTAAHNTVELDGTDSTEVWGAFRAGRRARCTLEHATVRADGAVEVAASHDGYRHLAGAPRHRRTWHITDEQIALRDEVTGSGQRTSIVRLHLVGNSIEVDGTGRFRAVTPGTEPTGLIGLDLGRLQPAVCVEFSCSGPLPLAVETVMSRRPVSANRAP